MLINRLKLMPRDIEDNARLDAIRRYPEESIGVIRRGKYQPLKNIAGETKGPDGKYLDPRDCAIPEKEPFQNMLMDGDVDALIHSHPDGVFGPSEADMIAQMNHCIPYGVLAVYGGAASRVSLWGDELERLDIKDRKFQHGISDCYEAIRDRYFIDKGWIIKQFPRDWQWWQNGKTLYESGFQEAGFDIVPADEAQPYDVVMFKIRSNTYTHAGVFLGNGVFYHHATGNQAFDPNNKAKVQPIDQWLKHDPLFVRPNENHKAIRKTR